MARCQVEKRKFTAQKTYALELMPTPNILQCKSKLYKNIKKNCYMIKYTVMH